MHPTLKGRPPAELLGAILAIIHGDGGHYQAEHGDAKATEDAIAKYYATRFDAHGVDDSADSSEKSAPEVAHTSKTESLLDEAWRLLMAAPVVEHHEMTTKCVVCRWQEEVQAFASRRSG
jgi:hypothetical protein